MLACAQRPREHTSGRRRDPVAAAAASRLSRAALVCLALATSTIAASNAQAAPTTDPPTNVAPTSPSNPQPRPAPTSTSGPPPHTAPTPSPAAAPASDPTPLLTYAASHHFPPVFAPAAQIGLQKQVSRITFDLAKDPPPATDCAQTLGAKRFATLYDDLAQTYSNMGKHVEAVDAYAKAIACNPRADFLHAELAASLLDLGHYSDARVETQRQLYLGRANFTLYTLITQLDFIEGRWPDAINSARAAATDAPNDEQATYWQCFLWLAQMHAGITEPVLVKRRISETWPAPILESLQGKITEAELAEAVEEEHDPQRQRDILSEALFYTGQQRLATHHVDEAVRYFTATVDLKVLYFIEHQLATAELRKLRHPNTGTPDQNSNTPLM